MQNSHFSYCRRLNSVMVYKFVNSGFIFFYLLVGDVHLNFILVRSRFWDMYIASGYVVDDGICT